MLEINPEEANLVHLIHFCYVSGLGAQAIVAELNEQGYSYRGKEWSKNRVLDITGNEA